MAFAWAATGPARTAAQAEAPIDGLTLTWDAPAECPGSAQLLKRIRGHLPADYRAHDAIAAKARVQRARGRYVLALRLSGSAGEAEREATAATCEALSDLAALLVALALDPAASPEARSAQETAPAPAAEGASSPPPSAAVAPSTSGASRTPPARTPPAQPASPPAAGDRSPSVESEPGSGVTFTQGETAGFAVDLGLAFALDLGTLPQRPAPGGRVDAGARFGRLRAGIGLAFWPAIETLAETYPSARLLGRALFGELALGVELARSPVSVVASAVFEVGELAIETRGITRPSRGDATWLGAGARMHAAYPLWEGLALSFDLSVVAPFSRPAWFVHLAGGDVTVFTVSPIAMRGTAGLSYVID